MADLIFFSILAIILVFKLRGILGREDADADRTEHDAAGRKAQVDITLDAMRHKSSPKHSAAQKEVVLEVIAPSYSYSPADTSTPNLIAEDAVAGFSAISNKLGVSELAFVQEFGEVFIAIVSAYNGGDLLSIQRFVSNEILENISAALQHAKSVELKEHAVVVRILRIFIEGANIVGDLAKVVVSVESEQIHYVTDKEGKVVQGDNSLPRKGRETFTVVRQLGGEGSSSWVVSEIGGL